MTSLSSVGGSGLSGGFTGGFTGGSIGFSTVANGTATVAGDESAVPSLATNVNVTVAPVMVGTAVVGATCVIRTGLVSVPLGIL